MLQQIISSTTMTLEMAQLNRNSNDIVTNDDDDINVMINNLDEDDSNEEPSNIVVVDNQLKRMGESNNNIEINEELLCLSLLILFYKATQKLS